MKYTQLTIKRPQVEIHLDREAFCEGQYLLEVFLNGLYIEYYTVATDSAGQVVLLMNDVRAGDSITVKLQSRFVTHACLSGYVNCVLQDLSAREEDGQFIVDTHIYLHCQPDEASIKLL